MTAPLPHIPDREGLTQPAGNILAEIRKLLDEDDQQAAPTAADAVDGLSRAAVDPLESRDVFPDKPETHADAKWAEAAQSLRPPEPCPDEQAADLAFARLDVLDARLNELSGPSKSPTEGEQPARLVLSFAQNAAEDLQETGVPAEPEAVTTAPIEPELSAPCPEPAPAIAAPQLAESDDTLAQKADQEWELPTNEGNEDTAMECGEADAASVSQLADQAPPPDGLATLVREVLQDELQTSLSSLISPDLRHLIRQEVEFALRQQISTEIRDALTTALTTTPASTLAVGSPTG